VGHSRHGDECVAVVIGVTSALPAREKQQDDEQEREHAETSAPLRLRARRRRDRRRPEPSDTSSTVNCSSGGPDPVVGVQPDRLQLGEDAELDPLVTVVADRAR
jgi:hypothetical protein